MLAVLDFADDGTDSKGNAICDHDGGTGGEVEIMCADGADKEANQ